MKRVLDRFAWARARWSWLGTRPWPENDVFDGITDAGMWWD